jgi:surface polysaccharide O-acyltransferase-like enzyme
MQTIDMQITESLNPESTQPDGWQLPPEPTRAASRIHYLDNLRALAMMLGVFLHAALAYANPAQSIWLATDRESSIAVDTSIWFIHLFRMALFFLISGYFAKVVIERKGIKAFLWNRTVRLVFPFLLFYPFLLGAMTGCVVFGLSYVKQPTGLLGLISAATKDAAWQGKAPPPTTMHLWFLYYLVFFSLAAALMSRIRVPRWTWIQQRPWLIVFAPLALVPGAVAGGVPMGAPESFIPHWWPFLFYGIFYLCGWCLFGRENIIDAMGKYWMPLSIVAVALFIPYYRMMPVLDLTRLVPLTNSRLILEGVIGSYLSALLVLLALLAGHQILDWRSSVLQFVSDSSYWIYLVHLPIVVLIQMLLIEAPINMWLKLSIVTCGTFIVCLVTYVVFVRYTPIGRLLNGKRRFP